MSARREVQGREEPIEFRAKLEKRGLAFLRERDPEAFERVVERLEPVARARVLEAHASTWIPFEDQLAVLEAERAALGDERFRAFCRERMKDMWSLPFVEPLLSGAAEVLGLTPETLLRLSARGWLTAFRRGGRLRYETLGLERCGVLVLEGFPKAHLRSGTFELATAGAFEAYFDLCGTDGEVDVSEEPNTLRFIFRWA